MLIISKYKDYYDYLQGIYGIDYLKVLDRTSYKPVTLNLKEDLLLVLCGRVFKREVKKDPKKVHFFGQHEPQKSIILYRQGGITWQEVNFDKKETCPIVVEYSSFHNSRVEYYPLNNLEVPAFIPPEECYRMLENFISKKDPESNKNPFDLNRFEAKGFNKKTSFRH